MSSVINVTDEVLIKSIREILESADLNVMTAKLVRNELKTKLDVEDLDSRKKQINSIINDVINELNQRNQKQSKDTKSESNVNNKSDETPKNNKQKESKESEDSSSDHFSDANEDNDEQLARKLHNEELTSKRRTTRNKTIRSVKKTKTKKNKDNKDNSDDSESEKPKKKRKNGYLKPCVLSPDLADFLGEPEMARHEVVKRIWSYVKENNLLDPKNKQFAICDNQLNKIFGRKRVRMFGMMKFLAKHLN